MPHGPSATKPCISPPIRASDAAKLPHHPHCLLTVPIRDRQDWLRNGWSPHDDFGGPDTSKFTSLFPLSTLPCAFKCLPSGAATLSRGKPALFRAPSGA